MAAFLSQERNKLGTTTGSLIAFPRELDVNDPTVGLSASLLPAGYLRCDGSVYNETQYPALAEILGLGDLCVFKQTGVTLTTSQFQVPDLRSKFIKASSGSDQGVLNDLTVTNAANQLIDKSGVGIEVSSNVGTTATITLSGQFRIPPVTAALRGNVSFTRPRYVDSEIVPANGFQPHCHYTTTRRCRIKRRAGSDMFELNYYRNASTIGVHEWYYHTMVDGPGGNQEAQPACRLYAESINFTPGNYIPSGFGVSYQYYGVCKNACAGFNIYCLVPSSQSTTQSGDNIAGQSPSIIPLFIDTTPNTCFQTLPWPIGQQSMTCASSSLSISSNYIAGATGVGTDDIPQTGTNGYSHTADLSNVMPFDTAVDTGIANTVYPQISNVVVTTNALNYESDPTDHTHTINYETGTTNYNLNTTEFFVSTDGMTSTINITPDQTKKMDNLIAPFIMVDYLIKV